jgi:small-conductance mechanosensitive channel
MVKRRLPVLGPTLRAFAIILAIVAVIVIFQLYATLMVIGMLAQIAFFLAIAYFVFLLWRNKHEEIGLWSKRSRFAFYGAFWIVIANLGVYYGSRIPNLYTFHLNGITAVAWILVFPLCAYAAWRVWHYENTFR